MFIAIFRDMAKFKRIGNLLSQFFSKSSFGFNGENVNVFARNFFDFNTSIFRADDGGSLGISIKNESKVVFLDDINSFVNQNRLNGESIFDSLVSDKVISDHLTSVFLDLFGRFTELDSSLKSRGQVSFSSTSGVNLGFYDQST